jgi:nuclear protein localization family protein 4
LFSDFDFLFVAIFVVVVVVVANKFLQVFVYHHRHRHHYQTKMLIRVRSRDGLERVTVEANATVKELQSAIAETLNVPVSQQLLSRNRALLLAKEPDRDASFTDMKNLDASLSSLGLGHGAVVYLVYSGERIVAGPPVTPHGTFGKKMTMDDLIARQTRIERQEKPHCSSLSLDREAADSFQHYVHQSLAFSVKRGGFMYGSVNEAGEVSVEFIYEPPQQGSEDSLLLMRDMEEEKHADIIAAGLGSRKVGFIFTQTVSQTKRDYTLSSIEIRQAAQLHAESEFECWATAIVKLEVNDEGGTDVHFEAFQLSDQCVKLYKEGCFVEDCPDLDPKLSRMAKDVVILSKDTRDVDNDFFLVLVKILDHEGPLSCTFPVENRESFSSLQALKAHLERTRNKPYVKRIADFHLLLLLSNYLDVNTDIPQLMECIRVQGPVPDGYQLIIESLASHF